MVPHDDAAARGVMLDRVRLTVGQGRAERVLIDQATASFEPGEMACVVGPSGAGKTSLLRAIAGLAPVQGGTLRVSGQDVAALSDKRKLALRRRSVATVFQEYGLVDILTAQENVRLGIELATGKRRRGGTGGLFAQLGLTGLEDEFPATLSGGEQQRVAIARALAASHPVVLADEPTGALDAGNTANVVARLRLIADAGRCLVIATHDDAVAAAADSVWQISGQRLVPA
ncbi:MAG: ATP-binding cassette domain-containing protein [Bifidobacteriaceae bacterium]|jgi:putative ABC transport system ATP-binding protein|nr:ATP-binding cassette domain-containing protein [Bifidobacteriaceae bacterium]